MNLSLKAKSSKDGFFYNVEIIFENDLLKIFCDCPAGIHGKFCKHKWQVLGGNEKILFDISETDKLDEVSKMASIKNYHKLYARVNDLELEMEKIKKQITHEKKLIEKKFREGF